MPSAFAAGTTVKYVRTTSDYPANAGWSLVFHLAGASVITPITAAASGADHAITIPAAVTEKLLPGIYRWQELVSKSGDKFVLASGAVQVTANMAMAGAGDMQSWEEKTLAVVEAALSGRLTTDMESYQIAGRAVTKIAVADLMKLRNQLKITVAQQRSGGFGTPVAFAFTGESTVRTLADTWPA